jgi:hypothetical protein
LRVGFALSDRQLRQRQFAPANCLGATRGYVGTRAHRLETFVDSHQGRGFDRFYGAAHRHDHGYSCRTHVVGQVHDRHDVVFAECVVNGLEATAQALHQLRDDLDTVLWVLEL